MKRTSFALYWLVIILAAPLLLSACERPIPRDITPVVTEAVPPVTTPIPAVETPVVPDITDPAPDPAEPAPVTEPEPTPVPEQPAPAPPAGERTHTVQPGETLFRISQQYGVSVNAIAAANNIVDVHRIAVGQQLVIPGGEVVAPPVPGTGERTHTVQRGENLFRIGLTYGFTAAELAQYNGIANPNQIEVGQVIRIPPGN